MRGTRSTYMKNAYKILIRKSEGRDHSEDLCSDGRIILKETLSHGFFGVERSGQIPLVCLLTGKRRIY